MLEVEIEKKLGKFQLQVSLHTPKDVTGILGASGCGKSMLLRCIAGIEKPDKGKIVLNGKVLFDSQKKICLPPQKRRVGYLFQNYALFPNMTVRQNILCGLYREKESVTRKRTYQDALQLLQLDTLEHHLPHQISGGQAQRTALARILVNQPQLLMLDEPFSALDSHMRNHLQMETKRLLAQYDGTVLLVTHSHSEAYQLCDSIAPMDTGRLLTIQPTKQLFAHPGTIATAQITGCQNIIPAKKIGKQQVLIPDWGISLQTQANVEDRICAIGIPAQYFDADTTENRFAVQTTTVIEKPLEWLIGFRYPEQKKTTPDAWCRICKDGKPLQVPSALGVSTDAIQLLSNTHL